jgi:hypothetical protein
MEFVATFWWRYYGNVNTLVIDYLMMGLITGDIRFYVKYRHLARRPNITEL